MKNIILQHYTGTLGELEKLSSANMQKYADKIGADYHLIRGNKFSEKLRPPLQKLYMLDKEFDEYDNTLMVDIDGFSRTDENIFDYEGVGQHIWIQTKLRKELAVRFPLHCSEKAPYWGGFIYKLSKDLRLKLREGIDDWGMLIRHNPRHNKGDEGVMHCLATKAGLTEKNMYFNHLEWGWPGFWFEDGMKTSKFIHVRDKIGKNPDGTGIKAPKIESYKKLNKMGLIE